MAQMGRMARTKLMIALVEMTIKRLQDSTNKYLMVYGRILYNTIREYTPKWYPTIPYAQTTKPTFTRGRFRCSRWNQLESTKTGWKFCKKYITDRSWANQCLIIFFCFCYVHILMDPAVALYKSNNTHRTYAYAIANERAYKRKMKEEAAKLAAQEEAEGGEEEE